ncbi:hypothetical protein D3C76_1363830 [compost metagenome]
MGPVDLIVDITEHYEQKEKSLLSYRSQFEIGAGTVSTPLNQGYIERVRARDSLLGQRSLISFAEGFASITPYVVGHFGAAAR